MKKEHYIIATEFCSSHNIEISFLLTLDENGLISLEKTGDILYIEENQLPSLERIVNLYFDLGVNIEGIETIINLLERVHEMQNEIILLRNKLRLYE